MGMIEALKKIRHIADTTSAPSHDSWGEVFDIADAAIRAFESSEHLNELRKFGNGVDY